MSLIKSSNEVGIAGEINLYGESTIAIVGEALVAWLDIANIPVWIPPSSCYTNLRIGCFNSQIEGLCLHSIPEVLWNLGNTLIVAVVTSKGKTVCTTPTNSCT